MNTNFVFAKGLLDKINYLWYIYDMKNIGIFYFSSTGNSLYIAQKIKENLGGKIVYIPTYGGNGSEFDNLIIVTPIYSFGFPMPVYNLLPRLSKNVPLIAIQNYGGMVGGADRLFYEYALRHQLNIKSIYTMKMPENFTLVMSPPTFYKNSILKTADKRIDKIISAIRAQNYVVPRKKRLKEKTYLTNKSNWHMIGERFSASDLCVKCGKCVSICPAQNITISDGKIKFGSNCIACLGCFHRCPQKAIIYKNKDNKKRYINPFVNEQDIGKDDL